MTSTSVSEFWALANRDAAVQEKVAEAAKQPEPLQALLSVALEAGFQLKAEDLDGSLTGELSDKQLAQVAGGVSQLGAGNAVPTAGFRAPGEWFAEQFTSFKKD